ncbi:alpha/beta hydrolase [Nevskia sp.]|uniref:alpha/beta fold hydrolase n=1 Tax=Nevskia sp. TaxID=1929292 RepID=UPI0025D3168B|nr:alpha/beta hydrolase [Nevskia sp.]
MSRWRHALLVLATLLATGWAQPPPSAQDTAPIDDHIPELFPRGPQPEAGDYEIDGRRVHYVVMPGGPQRLIFIHGTPGNWQGWRDYLADPRLRQRATIIAVDRPGFGNSGRGRMVPDIADQARLLAPLLDLADGGQGKAYLVGHSLGGPIAAKLAMDHPERVAGALLIAPSIAPDLEHPRWFNHMADTWLAKALAGTWVQRQFADDDLYNSNAEIMPLARGLKAMEPGWASLTMPVIVVQGLQDTLVDPATADYAERVLPTPNGRVIRLPNHDHFLIWSDYERCARLVAELMDHGS